MTRRRQSRECHGDPSATIRKVEICRLGNEEDRPPQNGRAKTRADSNALNLDPHRKGQGDVQWAIVYSSSRPSLVSDLVLGLQYCRIKQNECSALGSPDEASNFSKAEFVEIDMRMERTVAHKIRPRPSDVPLIVNAPA